MTSSSSSWVPVKGWTYDVFLSFRGEDTRNNFVDHLHTALVQKGIRVFRDDEMLPRGNLISSELLKAIEESRFAVVVFSKHYADSCWCLDELVKINDCQDSRGQKVLPIFYHVDPSDVRGQKGDFETAFQQHEEKFREEMDKVNKWRKALAAAGNLSGWHISPVNGGESLFIEKIVQKIHGDIKPCSMENNLIDIESRINRLNSLLGMEATHEVRMVGIHGMGGIGKTTIARALFKRISYKFDGSSFVNDVRENGSSKRGICALQKKIIKDVLASHHESEIEDPKEGAEMIQTRFRNKKVLLVLDDVDDFKQLEFLAATHEWFGVGSRIIITTRDEHLLSDTDDKYKPAILLKEHAVELFSWNAFRKISPPEGFEELSNRVIRYTGGLPLALKVLGSFFHGREVGVWESALNRLAKMPHPEIFEMLKLSFDGLESSEKKIFLDIACFFKGRDKEHVTRVLDSFGFDAAIGICTLFEKSLITISNKCIDMHDVLQEMGFEIVRKSYPNSRLWKPEEIEDFIMKNRKLEAIEGIVVPWTDHLEEGFRADVFENMKNLRLLDIYGKFTSRRPTSLPDELQWLKWDGYPYSYRLDEKEGFRADVFENMKNLRLLDIYGKFTSRKPTSLPDELQWLTWVYYPYSSLPLASMRKLVGLELSDGSIQHLWKGYKFLPNLKFIHIEALKSLERFPDVSGAPNVERLTLKSCSKLVKLHKSLGTLRKLVYLEVGWCHRLEKFPSLIEMVSLETLHLFHCSGLEKFPEVSSANEKLSKIHIDGCDRFEVIPRSICELRNLKSLRLQDCEHLQILPEELGSMETLEELKIGFVTITMYYFPLLQQDSINFHALTKLSCLRKLDISHRPIGEQDFPHNFHEFSSLEELDLSHNQKLVQLPASISRLSCLKHLNLNYCQQLKSIQGLPVRIQVLRAGSCKALETIEDLTKEYVWLYKIWLHGCKRLQENEEYLDKMLQQFLLKKCAAVDHVLSICIPFPGSKIPSWFEEQQDGHKISLKLPPKCDTDIKGFAVCGVLRGSWGKTNTNIHFRVGLNSIPEWEVGYYYIDTFAVTKKESIWIVYIPFSLFQQHMYDEFGGEDWSRFVERNLMISIYKPWDENWRYRSSPITVKRCGAHLVYKEDVESIQQFNTCIPDYRNSNIALSIDADSFIYTVGINE